MNTVLLLLLSFDSLFIFPAANILFVLALLKPSTLHNLVGFTSALVLCERRLKGIGDSIVHIFRAILQRQTVHKWICVVII